MRVLLDLIALALHAGLVLAAAPVLAGLVAWLRERLEGWAGPPVSQPWRDLARLARRQPVLAGNASVVFGAAPLVACAATVAAALLVPSFTLGMASAPAADLLAIGGLLGLARAAVALAGMDVGSAAGGRDASRAMCLSAFSEPAFALVVLALAILAGSTNLDAVAGMLRTAGAVPRASLGLALLALLAVGMVENGRAPVGHPPGEMEFSGRHLALLRYAADLKLLLWLSLIAAVFAPFGIAAAGAAPWFWLAGLLAWVVKLGVLAGLLALCESTVVRMREARVAELLGVAVLLGALAAVLLLVGQGGA